jgi:hypothetical protein
LLQNAQRRKYNHPADIAKIILGMFSKGKVLLIAPAIHVKVGSVQTLSNITKQASKWPTGFTFPDD